MESVDYQARLRASFTCSFQIFSFILFEKKKKKIHWNVERWLSYPATLPFFFFPPPPGYFCPAALRCQCCKAEVQVKSGAKCAVKGLTTRENQHTEAPRKSKRAPKVNV